jgi:hypothetical protein
VRITSLPTIRLSISSITPNSDYWLESITMRRIGSDEEDSQGDDDRDRLGDIIVGTQWEVCSPLPASSNSR